jgi:hypothetical protein
MQNIILKALEVDPLKRFAAMEDFGNAVHKKKYASFGKRLLLSSKFKRIIATTTALPSWPLYRVPHFLR